MAASNGMIEFSDGRRISIYFASSGAAGTYCPIDSNQVALATSKTEYKEPFGGVITGVTQGAATGTIQVVIDGNRKPVLIDMADHAVNNSGRPKLNIPVGKGENLSFVVASALAA